MLQCLAHGVRRPLKPIRLVHGLVGGDYLDKTMGKGLELIGTRNMLVQGFGIELRQDLDLVEA
jgi:hypothetical protein